jgi:hypothetical protein
VSAVAVLFYGLAVADLVRASPLTASRPVVVPAVVGSLGSVVVALLAGLTAWRDAALVVVAMATVVAWVVLAERALRHDRTAGWALAAPLAGTALVVALSGWSSAVSGPFARWLEWTGIPLLVEADPQVALLVPALVLLQLATGNVVVRLVLTHVGAISAEGRPQPSDQLRGGRVLGPMERIFILGLGLAGEVTAASLVIAAKGLIRWPELQSARRAQQRPRPIVPGRDPEPAPPTIDELTEYFLVGSFISWLVAMSCLALSRLA